MRARFLIALLACLVFVGCGSPGHASLESARTPDGAIAAPPPRSLSLSASPIHISANGVHLLESNEGFSSCPYRDTVGTGHPETRGFGETEGITPSSPCISRAQGERFLVHLIETRYQWAIRGLGVPFTQNQVDALDSFAYNLGAGIFTGSLRVSIQHHNPLPMLAYDHASGVVLAGLFRRRHEEVALFLKPAPVAKVSRAYLVHRIAVLHRLLSQYHCRTVHGPHAYRLCPRWAREGKQAHRELRKI